MKDMTKRCFISRLNTERQDGTDEAQYQNAQVCIEEGRLSEAVAILKDMIASNGNVPLWHNDLGCLYFTLGDIQRAKVCFEKAVQLDSNFTVALENLADLYSVMEGRIDEAITLYRKILEHQPDDIQTMAVIGKHCARIGQISGLSLPLSKQLIEKLRIRGVSTLLGPGATLPMDVVFEPPCSFKWMNISHSLRLGAFSYATSGFYFGCHIGRYCSFGEQVQIGRHPHPLHYVSTSPFFYKDFREIMDQPLPEDIELNPSKDINRKTPPTIARITEIGNDVWIGHGAFILPGITIGEGAAVAAMSVVTKNVPPYAVVAGSPARVIRYRFSEEQIKALTQSRWWEFAPWSLKGATMDDVDGFIQFVEVLRTKGTPVYAPKEVMLSELILEETSPRQKKVGP